MAAQLRDRMLGSLAATAWYGVVGVLLIAVAGPAQAQESTTRPPRARDYLKAGLESHKQNDYEKAAKELSTAQSSQRELTNSERKDLEQFVKFNNDALKFRREGAALLRKAEMDLKAAKIEEVRTALLSLETNQYLTAEDKRRVSTLRDSFNNLPMQMPVLNLDARTLLQKGRECLRCGQLESAEAFAHEAQKDWPGWRIIGDTPSALLRDVQAERKVREKQMARPVPQPVPNPESKSSLWPWRWKSPFRRGEDGPRVEDKGTSPLPTPPVSDRPQPTGDGPIIPLPPSGDAKPMPKTSDSRDYSPLRGMRNILGWDPRPTITRMSDQELPLPPKNSASGPATPAGEPGGVQQASFPGEGSDDPRAVAQKLLREAQHALELNDLDAARSYALQAKETKVPFRPTDLTPERVLVEIQRREKGLQATGAAPRAADAGTLPQPPKTPTDPKVMVRQARELVNKGQFDEAEKLLSNASAIRPKGWGLFEDSPDRVRTDLNKLRSRSGREQADVLMVQARKAFDAGRIEEAKSMAYQAQKLHGPYSVWDFGDRPQRLLNDIHRVEITRKPGTQDHVANRADLSKQRYMSSSDPTRSKSATLLAEARELAGKGQLVEARQKALDAKQLNVPAQAGEETPESLLANLNGLCGLRLNQMLQQSLDVLNSPLDEARFQKAEGMLAHAKGLCLAFGLDANPIDQRLQFVRDAQSGKGDSSHQARKVTSPEKLLGMEKLDKARLELRAGNTNGARKMAEDAFAYGVAEEAAALIRTIDAEEYNQGILASNRTADAGIDAYMRRDFRQASSILGSIDSKRISPDRQRRVREIMAMAEMQPESLAKGNPLPLATQNDKTPQQLALEQGAGRASAGDLPRQTLTESARAMEKVQFEYFRQQALVAQTTAMEYFRTDPDRAVEVLREYLKKLETNVNFDAQQMAALRHPVEARIAQYRTLIAQRDIEREQRQASRSGHDETTRTANIGKGQEQVVELMKRYRALLKEGKLEEALAEARKMKELDPDNVAADYAIQTVSIQLEMKRWNANKAKNEEYGNEQLTNQLVKHVVTSDNPVAFDQRTAERSRARAESAKGYPLNSGSSKEKAIHYKLQEPVNLNFKDTELHQVISDLNSISGLNVVPDREALDEAGIRLDQRLTLKVENISLQSALKILLKQVNLTHVVKDDVLNITTHRHARGVTKRVVHNVADLVIPVEDHPAPTTANFNDAMARHIAGSTPIGQTTTPFLPNYAMQNGTPVSASQSQSPGLGNAFSQSSPGARSGTASGPKAVTKADMPGLLISLITETIAPNTWKDAGGEGNIQYFPLGMALVISQTQDVQEQVIDLLAALRRLQDLEVAIEMRLVSVSEAFYERMGMDFDVNIRTPTSRREPDLLNSAFTPFGTVNRNLDRLNMVSGLTPAGTLTPDLNIPIKNSSFDFTIPPFGGYPGTLGADGGLSLGLAFLSDIQVFMFLEAAQGDRRTNVMQAPKITVFNGQNATISVQDQQFFLTNISVNMVGAQVFFSPQQQPVPLGVQLNVTPVVSADRRFVRLNLSPQMTNLASATVPLFPVQTVIPGQLLEGPGTGVTVAGQPQIMQMFFQQPTFTQISITTTVNVPDGGTVLLGGLKTLSEARNETGPPILSKIPYLNRLFKNVAYGREAQSLMIMVTPRIIINEEEEQIFLGQLPPVPRP